MSLRRYLAVWRLPGAPLLLVGSMLARLGLGMTPLALVLVVERSTGEFTPAALASAGYALAGAAASPVAGRLADRYGPAPVLAVTGVLHPGTLVLLVATASGRHGLGWTLLVAALAGASYPPMTAAVRAAWNTLTERGTGREHLNATALAAETSLFEIVFVVGPVGVALFVALAGSPAAAILGSAGVTLVGTLAVIRGRLMRSLRPRQSLARTRGLGPLRVAGFPALLVCTAGLGIVFGVCGVAVPAFAAQHAGSDADGVAGLLLAVWGLGSAASGLWFGTRRPAMPLHRQLAWLLTALTVTLLLFSVMPTTATLGVALAFGGATIAPALTVMNSLIGRFTPGSMVNEAYTWEVTVSIAFSSLGGALAGVLIDAAGASWAFLMAAGAALASVLVAAAPGGPLARADALAVPPPGGPRADALGVPPDADAAQVGQVGGVTPADAG